MFCVYKPFNDTQTMSDMKSKSVKGSKTEQNLIDAYMAETQAYARYTFYAKQADKEEYFPIGEAFRETADNELRHAKVFLKSLGDVNEMAVCSGAVHAGFLGDTAANLVTAIEEEDAGGYQFYTESAKVARSEGFDEIADHFTAIAAVEKLHCKRFETYLRQVKDGTVWKREKPVRWRCLVCGYESVGTEPPRECPACDHPDRHYMALDV